VVLGVTAVIDRQLEPDRDAGFNVLHHSREILTNYEARGTHAGIERKSISKVQHVGHPSNGDTS
jgi:hypothetical protein